MNILNPQHGYSPIPSPRPILEDIESLRNNPNTTEKELQLTHDKSGVTVSGHHSCLGALRACFSSDTTTNTTDDKEAIKKMICAEIHQKVMDDIKKSLPATPVEEKDREELQNTYSLDFITNDFSNDLDHLTPHGVMAFHDKILQKYGADMVETLYENSSKKTDPLYNGLIIKTDQQAEILQERLISLQRRTTSSKSTKHDSDLLKKAKKTKDYSGTEGKWEGKIEQKIQEMQKVLLQWQNSSAYTWDHTQT